MSVKRVEVVERSQMDTLPFLLLFCESGMFVKENPDRKEKTITLKNRFFSNIFNINIRNKFMIGISWLVSHEVCIHIQYFFGVVRNKLQTKEDQKFKKRICHVNMLYILINEKHFPKTINQWGFDYSLFTNLPRIIVAQDFSPSSFKLKRGIRPLLTEYVC